jgi:hypothetical protein
MAWIVIRNKVIILLSSVPERCWVRDEAPDLGPRVSYNVLLDQSYHTPHGGLIDEYGAMVE